MSSPLKHHKGLEAIIQNSETQKSITPRPELWDRLENRLDHVDKDHTIFKWKRIAIAACVACLITTVTLFQEWSLDSAAIPGYEIEELNAALPNTSSSTDYLTDVTRLNTLFTSLESKPLRG